MTTNQAWNNGGTAKIEKTLSEILECLRDSGVVIRDRIEPQDPENLKLNSPGLIAKEFDFLTDLPQEEFWVLYLNAKHQEIGRAQVSKGTATASLVHPRAVFRGAIAANAVAIVCAHNHPSGSPTPSQEDVLLTDRLAEAGSLLGIEVLDHIVVAKGGYHSAYQESRTGRGKA